MRLNFRICFLVVSCLVFQACPHAPPSGSPLLRVVRQINPDGATIKLAEEQLTPFQRYIRQRLPRAPAPLVSQLFMLEVDVPGGTGTEGAYLVVALFPGGAEFEYFEQFDHRPRNDRYFHRRLTAEEQAAFLNFMGTHPIENLRVPPATAPAATIPALAATEPDADAIVFRFTNAQWKEARVLDIVSPGVEDHPAIDLVRQFSTLRDAREEPPLVCSYILVIPTNAEILYADPQRHVLDLWYGVPPSAGAGMGEAEETPRKELRAQIYPPLNFSFAEFTDESKVPLPQWYALRGGAWVAADAPPVPETQTATEPETQPATQEATQPATRPLYPRLPSHVFTLPEDMEHTFQEAPLPTAETWVCQPGLDHTEVWHYVPIDEQHGQWLGFVVPVLVFDNEHMRVDAAHRVMYLIHDGQLIGLPIPNAALFLR